MHNVDVRNVSLGQIMYFIKVAETMNISMTAEYFHLTQPVLSKKMASLEKQLDLQLFIRTNRLVSLTPAGKYLYERWKNMVSQVEEDIQQAHILQTGRSKSLVIACMDSFRPESFLVPLIELFRQAHPDIHLRIESDAAHDIRSLLQNGEADIIFSIQYDFDNRDMDQITCRFFGETSHCACMKRSNSLTLNIHSDQEIFICDKYYADGNSKDHVLIPIRDTKSHIVAAWRKDNPKKYLADFIKTTEEVF